MFGLIEVAKIELIRTFVQPRLLLNERLLMVNIAVLLRFDHFSGWKHLREVLVMTRLLLEIRFIEEIIDVLSRTPVGCLLKIARLFAILLLVLIHLHLIWP